MSRVFSQLHLYVKNRVSDLSYAYGFFVADHSLYIILVCFGIFLLSLFQITTNLPPPGSSLEIFSESSQTFRPVRARLELNTSDQLHDKQPDKPLWYSGYPLAYVQHLVIRCSHSSCWTRARDVRDRLLSDSRFESHCLRVGEALLSSPISPYLPSFGCLFLSPLNLGSTEREIIESISTLSKRSADLLFGLPQKFFSTKSSFTYAITLLLTNTSNAYREELKKQLNAIDDTSSPTTTDDIVHIYFSKKPWMYYLPLFLIYLVVFLYIYYSVNQFECVQSKWGLALAATVQIVVSLLISLALSSLFHMTPRLDGGEVFPYLVIFIGLENLVVLTRAVTSAQAQKQFDDIRERVAHALRAESWTISKHLVYELVIVMIGFITYVPTIREFCQLALIGILIDFFMQINFWLAVLSIDIRRFTVGLRKKTKISPSYVEEHRDLLVSLPMKMPTLLTSKRQGQSQWARYRVLQRGSMCLVLLWVILIFYKSCLIVDLLDKNVQIDRDQIKDYVPEKMLNEHYGSFPHEPSMGLEDPMFNNTHLPNYDWQSLLAYDHWPTLFSSYNISYENRYLTIMPSIYLPVITSEDRSPSVLVDVTTKSSSTSTSHPVVADGRFSNAVWELLFLVVSGLTLFSLVYFCFFSSSSSSSQQQRSLSYVKSDHSIVPTILVPPRPGLLIESMCVHESGSVLCTSYSNGSVCLWNPQTGGLVFHHPRLSSSSHVWCSVMLDEYRCLLGTSTGEIELFSSDTRTTKPFVFVNEHLGGITDLLRVSSSMIIGITRRGYFLALEDLHTALREIYIKRIHQWPIRVARFDWNSSLIFTGSDDHSIKVTNLSNGLCLHTLHKHQSPVNCLALDPYHPTTLLSGCFSGTLCLWTGDGLRQAKINAHPSSLILDVNFSGHSSHLLSLGSDHRLCIWSYSSFDLLVELSSISSNSLLIFRTNYLFYCQGRDLYVYETLKSSKISTKQFPLNFLDESETKIDTLCYSSSSECVIVQHADVIYALHLPQDFFLF